MDAQVVLLTGAAVVLLIRAVRCFSHLMLFLMLGYLAESHQVTVDIVAG